MCNPPKRGQLNKMLTSPAFQGGYLTCFEANKKYVIDDLDKLVCIRTYTTQAE